jgi:probable HAF family extracellular repeat protein
MKSRILAWIAVISVFALPATPVFAQAQQQQAQHVSHYVVTDLGTLGGTFSIAFGINDRGQIDGLSTTPGDQVTHGFFLENGVMTDMGTLGGPNSQALFGPGGAAQATGLAENGIPDPNGEDFCGLGTNLICLNFVWQNGVMAPLYTLGGNNAQGSDINAQGQIAGMAENATPDPNCPAPQVLQFRPAVWTNGKIQALPVSLGDPEGAAFGINDSGDVVGASGTCAAYDLRYGVSLQPQHALLWRRGSVKAIHLGSLGGRINNAGFAINESEQVVGASDLPGDQFQHAFLWQHGVITDLGTLAGDVVSAAIGINNKGQATGVSIDAAGNLRAFLWQNGVMTDLNTLIPSNSPLYLMHGCGINSRGQIVGYALQISTGELHAYLATPITSEGDFAGYASKSGAGAAKVALSESSRKQLEKWIRGHGFATAPADLQGSPSR